MRTTLRQLRIDGFHFLTFKIDVDSLIDFEGPGQYHLASDVFVKGDKPLFTSITITGVGDNIEYHHIGEAATQADGATKRLRALKNRLLAVSWNSKATPLDKADIKATAAIALKQVEEAVAHLRKLMS